MILSILNELAVNSSRLKKEEILFSNQHNQLLKTIFRLTYSKQVNFYIKAIPEFTVAPTTRTLEQAVTELVDVLSTRKKTGDAGKAFLADVLSSVNDDDREVLFRLIDRDMKCGVSVKTAQKVWKGLLPKPEFQLAETDPKAIVYPASSQVKEDGTRARAIWTGTRLIFISRNGNEIETLGVFDEWAATHLYDGVTLDGELVAFNGSTRLSRKESNGIVNKALKGTISQAEAETLRYIAWDLEDPEEPYSTRLDNLKKVTSVGGPILLVDHIIVHSYEEALLHFKSCRKSGLEGTILKNLNAVWVPKRTFNMVKFKAEFEAEFKVVGIELGTGKNANRVGNLIIESEDSKIRTSVGIFKDFPEKIRDEWLTNAPKIVTVRYNERITSKGRIQESLFLPRVISARYDKDTADTYEQILAIEAHTMK